MSKTKHKYVLLSSTIFWFVEMRESVLIVYLKKIVSKQYRKLTFKH